MRFTRLATCALMFATSALAQSTTQSLRPPAMKDLSGLWAAKKRFGPDVRGTLVIARAPEGLRAEIAGRYAPVSDHDGEVAFELLGDEGRFTGRFEGKSVIRGHWVRPATEVSYGRAASPVVLRAID